MYESCMLNEISQGNSTIEFILIIHLFLQSEVQNLWGHFFFP